MCNGIGTAGICGIRRARCRRVRLIPGMRRKGGRSAVTADTPKPVKWDDMAEEMTKGRWGEWAVPKSTDPRVAKLAASVGGQFPTPYWLEWAADQINGFDAAGLAVVERSEPVDGQWDIGDPPPPADVISVWDEMGDDEDDDNNRWGRTTRNTDGWGDWKSYKNGSKVYLPWAELVRRWGPVRRG